MVKPAQNPPRADRAGLGMGCRFWWLQAERSMRPVGIVVGDELAQDGAQMLLVENDKVVQALAAQRPNHPLSHGVCPWSPDWRQQGLGPERPCSSGEPRPISAVAISDEVLRLGIPGRRLDELS